MARFPGPWAYGIAGLGEGFTEGLFAGQEAKRRKQEQERLKQGQAIQLLLGYFKAAQDDPDAAQQLSSVIGPMYQKLTGQPLPQMQATSPEKRVGREIGELDATIAALTKAHPDWSPDFVRQAAMVMRNYKLPKPEKSPGPTFMMTPQGPVQMDVPPGSKFVRPYNEPGYLQPGWTFGPQGQVVPLPRGYHTPPEILKPEKPEKPEPGTPATTQDIKDFHEAKKRLEDPNVDPSTREEDLAIVSQYEGVQTKEETVKTPPGFFTGAKEGKAIKVKAPPQLLKRRRLPPTASPPSRKYILKKKGVPVEVDKETYDAYWQKYGK